MSSTVLRLIAVPIGKLRARSTQRLAWSISMLRVESKASMSWVGLRAVVMCLPESVTRIERSLRYKVIICQSPLQ